MALFAPLQPLEGYLPLEDYGLIGDGAIPWLCVPRFDSPPVFCGILDAVRGGVLRWPPTISWRPGSFTSPTATSW